MRVLTKEELREGKPSREEAHTRTLFPITLVLDNVFKDVNVGAILRVADGMAAEFLAFEGSCDINTKAAAGTQKWVPHTRVESVSGYLQMLRGEGYHIVAVELTDTSERYDTYTWRYPLALVLGSENRSVSPEVLELCEGAVHIPMLGMNSSLNVACAAAIVAYHAALSYAHK